MTQIVTEVFERSVGAIRYVTVDLTDDLAPGETLTGTPAFTSENSYVTIDAGTPAVSTDGRMISARFTHVAAGKTRIDYTVSTTVPTETLKGWFVFITVSPSGV